MVLVATLRHPFAHPSFTAYIPYPSSFACEDARDALDSDAFKAIAPKLKGTKQTAVVATCGPLIPHA